MAAAAPAVTIDHVESVAAPPTRGVFDEDERLDERKARMRSGRVDPQEVRAPATPNVPPAPADLAQMLAGREHELVSELSRRVIAGAAPEELPLFRAVSRAYLDKGGRLPGSRRRGDELLGFGVETAAALLTPVVFEVAKTIVSFVLARARAAAERRAGAAVDDAVARVFARLLGAGEAKEHDPALDRQQLGEIRRLAYDRAIALDVPEEKATLLADALVGGLV
jgi:hypothetical protein